jgi:protein O-mannosyl-transferase
LLFSARTGYMRAFAAALLLFVVTVAVYHQVRHFDFIDDYDDGAYVVRNLHLQHGLNLKLVKWAFTSYYAGNWDPLTWLSHALDCRIFLLDAGRHHQTNVILHALSAVVLFWLLWRATGFMGRSLAVASFFALHPMNVESVAWIAERKNVLSMLFFLLALGAYDWYASAPANPKPPFAGGTALRRYLLVFFLYACSLMSKAQVITFPFVLLLWDYWPLERVAFRHSLFAFRRSISSSVSGEERSTKSEKRLRWLVLEKLPLLAISAVAAVLTVKASVAGGTMNGVRNSYPFLLRLENAIVSYPRYLGKLFWPAHLAIIYPYPKVSFGAITVSAALIFLIVVTGLCFFARHRARYLLVGWLWFLGTLVPMIGIVQVGSHPMADRFTYVPFIGLFIMICWGVADLLAAPSSTEADQIARGCRSPVWLTVLTAILLAALAVVSYRQIATWKDSLSLWSHAVAVTRNNDDAEDKLGSALQSKGRQPEAAVHFRAAAEINPDDPLINEHLGFVEQREGDLRQAIAHYERALELTQGDIPDTAAMRADALNNMGVAYRQLGDLVRAEQCFSAAKELDREFKK